MTRATNVGIKRTYVTSGFDERYDEPSNQTKEESTAPSGELQEPLKKKRKRNNHTNKAKKARKQQLREEGQTAPTVEAIVSAEDKASVEATKAQIRALKNQRRKRQREKITENQFRYKQPAASSERRRLNRISERQADTVCFACREYGHAVRDCPNDPSGEAVGKSAPPMICYRCGSQRHSLSKCPKPIPEDPNAQLPFATCYVCKASGHLAGTCPQNREKGVYPNGGSCKLCGKTEHLAKDCDLRRNDHPKTTLIVGQGEQAGADEDDFHVVSRTRHDIDDEESQKAKSKPKIKSLVGGKILMKVTEPERPPPKTRTPHKEITKFASNFKTAAI